jgi:hypothetical protein
VRNATARRGSIGSGERVRVAEELGQVVDDRVDVIGEWASGDGVVAMADEVSRRRGVLEEFVEGGSVEGDLRSRCSQVGFVTCPDV